MEPRGIVVSLIPMTNESVGPKHADGNATTFGRDGTSTPGRHSS